MANEFNFKDKNVELQKWWEEDNPRIPGAIEKLIQFGVEKHIESAVDKARWSEYNFNEKLCSDIGFYLGSLGDSIPIETVIGAIASVIKVSKEKGPLVVAKNLTTAGEIVFMLTPTLLEMTKTYNDRFIVRSKIYTKALDEIYLYPLPSNKKTKFHKSLGNFSWELTQTEALDKLNSLAFTVLNFEEPEPLKKDDEKHKKWLVRSKIRPKLAKKKLYFDWHSDYRGRMYAGGYHMNPQGNEYEKSIIAFAEPEKITDAGLVELKLAIARAYGKDKLTDIQKFKWYNENKDLRTATGMKKGLIPKEPHIARKLNYAMRQISLTGGYTNIPVELDGTNSQLQMVSVLTGDRKTAETCNVIPNKEGTVADAYGILADTMTAIAKYKNIK